MNSSQIHQMITTLGIDQSVLIKTVQEYYHNDYPVDSLEFKQSFVELLETMDLNFYQKLQMYSPLVNIHRDITFSNEIIQLHSHFFYEVLYCEAGNLQYLIGDHRYTIHSGDIILVPPGVSHRPIFHEQLKEPYSRIVIWISNEFINKLTEHFPEVHHNKEQMQHFYLVRTDNTHYASLKQYFLKGLEETQNKDFGWQGALYYNTGLLLTELYRIKNTKQINLHKEKESEVDRILTYVEKNYTNKITLEETAHHFLISKSRFTKLFSEQMGISFYRYVTQRRLIHAKKRMEEGESLDKIGISCGFNDYATFYRSFKKEYGLSPKEYQKLCK